MKQPQKGPRIHEKRVIPLNPDLGPAGWPLIALAIAVSVLPRVWSLGARSFTTAEARLVIQSSLPWKLTLQTLYWGAEKYLPYDLKYSFVVKAWSQIGGNGELWLRLFSVIAGLAGIWFAYLAARVVLGARPALFTCLMTALCPFHIAFSRTVGGEALLFAFCVAATYYFLKIYFEKARNIDYILYFVSVLAAMYLHYIGALVFIPANIIFFSFRAPKNNVYKWITVNAPLVAVFSVLMPGWRDIFRMSPLQSVQILEFYHPALMTTSLTISGVLLQSYFSFFFTAIHFFAADLLNVPLMASLIICVPLYHIAFLLGFREYDGGLKLRYFSFIMLGIAGLGATAMFFFNVPLAKGLVAAWPAFNIVIAGGIFRFGSPRIIKAFYAALILLFIGGLQSVSRAEHSAADWRAVVSRFDKLNPSGHPAIILDGWEGASFVYYSGSKPRWQTHALFPDFAPVMLDNNELLQDQITMPFGGRFDSYQDFIEKQVMENGGAWILYVEEDMRNIERIESEVDWADALKASGRAEIVTYKIPDQATINRHNATDGLRIQQLTLSHIIALGPGKKKIR